MYDGCRRRSLDAGRSHENPGAETECSGARHTEVARERSAKRFFALQDQYGLRVGGVLVSVAMSSDIASSSADVTPSMSRWLRVAVHRASLPNQLPQDPPGAHTIGPRLGRCMGPSSVDGAVGLGGVGCVHVCPMYDMARSMELLSCELRLV
ncbi:hypothetical protein FKP32DRAFT_1588915 [Trametes sanguinea]|nr:hypothetical protein FKP32DRAFT_1588915 [Trametes sanguinea]